MMLRCAPDCSCEGPEKVFICGGCPADRIFGNCDDCAEVQDILEEERRKLFTCFKSGRFGHNVESTVLDWETANGEERFIYVCHSCLEKYE